MKEMGHPFFSSPEADDPSAFWAKVVDMMGGVIRINQLSTARKGIPLH
jgi:hypothetical protein